MIGLLNLLKPVGLTSRDVVNRVQRLVRPDKAGHAGTLDPLASGVLVVCVGKATRLISYVQDRPKNYRGTFEFGKTSDTDDAEGEIVATGLLREISSAEFERVLPKFVGRISQLPPRYSAVHVEGRRAYDLARQGKEFEIAPREVQIDSLDIVEWNFPRVTLDIVCGSGTYIRSLGRDLGETLGCGAYMTDLIRTAVGEFELADALPLDDLSKDLILDNLIPAGEAVRHLPSALCEELDKPGILNGKRFVPKSIRVTDDKSLVAVYDDSDELVCLAEPGASGQLQPRQVFLSR
ncbi:MAG TPA: tRNA pseudouridine(55) synthase TruB [Planctomycetaceae bacterium]|nr:tRNA pseudouridine(55) synthase TruB [Planctomycetaceae bacterium]